MKLVDTYPEVDLDWLLKGKGSFPVKDDIEDDSVPQENHIKVENLTKQPIKPESTAFQEPSKEPYKIVMFYDDGTFATFNTKKD